MSQLSNEEAIPTSDALPQTSEDGEMNAYIYHFYIHGQVTPLIMANGIRRGDVWYLLQDFELVLKTITTGLEELLLIAASDEAQSETLVGDSESEGSEFEEDSLGKDGSGFRRPAGVRDEDWRVYEVIQMVRVEFCAKFRKMWA